MTALQVWVYGPPDMVRELVAVLEAYHPDFALRLGQPAAMPGSLALNWRVGPPVAGALDGFVPSVQVAFEEAVRLGDALIKDDFRRAAKERTKQRKLQRRLDLG